MKGSKSEYCLELEKKFDINSTADARMRECVVGNAIAGVIAEVGKWDATIVDKW